MEGRFAKGDHALHIAEINEDLESNDQMLGPLDPYKDDEHSIDWPLTPPRQPTTPVTPQHEQQDTSKSVKRQHSNTSMASGDYSLAPKRSRLTGPVAVQQVADAISSVACSFETADFGTPQRRTRAIKAVTSDLSLTKAEQIKAMRLFRKDIASADTYLAIDEPELRTAYLKDELAEF